MSPQVPLLEVKNLNVSFGHHHVVQNVSFTLTPGSCLALVGESGSGKSVTARSLIGLAGKHSKVSAQTLAFKGTDLLSLNQRTWRNLRGKDLGFILQDALTSLDPLRKIGREIDDALRIHTQLSPTTRAERVIELLMSVGLDDPEVRAGQLSGELSGGMRQRALIASAIALEPGLIIADEPTTALDATIAAQVLDLLGALRQQGSGMLLISHDLAAVSRVADDIAVMHNGRILESGSAEQVLGNPQHPYTQRLLAAVPAGKPRHTRLSVQPLIKVPGLEPTPQVAVAPDEPRYPVLTAHNLSKSFKMPNGASFTAVHKASFELLPGKTLSVIGESGSGKTTTARMVLGLLKPDTGAVTLFGSPWSKLSEAQRRPRRPQLGAIYQDPLSSFDPRFNVGQLLADALSFGATRSSRKHLTRIKELLNLVGLESGFITRNPATLSGGQRQRLAIARALAPNPRVLICDEPVSALDVSIQAQVLDLLDDLQRQLGLSYVFITHDLSVARHMSDDVVVMRRGALVESGPTEEVFTAPAHPYTRALLAAAPEVLRS
ncbi:ABC transporter ATP-binding protein [Arthrobacter sp. MYb227]|nr:ABC transporter ATP-binding protein [Arthrobacter sp. MYb227]